MWTQTQFLKNSLSPGQAFWMSQSCKSFLAFSGSCLSCSPKPGAASPCPPFTLGEASAGSCHARTVRSTDHLVAPIIEKLEKQLGAALHAPVADIPTSVYETRKQLSAELSLRFNELKAHVRGRRDLQLGNLVKGLFLDEWLPEFQLPEPPPTPQRAKYPKK